jgi:membrane protein YqaA with SNARE-associated domain
MVNIVEWTKENFLPLGGFGLFLLAFMEASFFPVPPDILLIILSLSEPENIGLFVLVCTLGSVLGGMFGYGLGYFFKYAFVEKLFSKEKIAKVHRLYEKHGVLAVFIGGFTPIPFKLITISAGLFYIDFLKFVIVALLSRGLRFSIVGGLLYFFNSAVKNFIENYLGVVSLFVVFIVLLGYWIIYKKLK